MEDATLIFGVICLSLALMYMNKSHEYEKMKLRCVRKRWNAPYRDVWKIGNDGGLHIAGVGKFKNNGEFVDLS
jgi:hypothetical protein